MALLQITERVELLTASAQTLKLAALATNSLIASVRAGVAETLQVAGDTCCHRSCSTQRLAQL